MGEWLRVQIPQTSLSLAKFLQKWHNVLFFFFVIRAIPSKTTFRDEVHECSLFRNFLESIFGQTSLPMNRDKMPLYTVYLKTLDMNYSTC